MFDVGFNELLLIAVIGLLVLGPERLPKVAAQIGRWVARARRTATQLRQELEREIALSEIAKAEKRAEEKRQSSRSEPDPEHDEAASDYESELYTTTHEGLGAEPGDRAAAHDVAGHAASEPSPAGHAAPEASPDEHAEPEDGSAAAGSAELPEEPERPERANAARQSSAPKHTRAAGEEPQEPADKTHSV